MPTNSVNRTVMLRVPVWRLWVVAVLYAIFLAVGVALMLWGLALLVSPPRSGLLGSLSVFAFGTISVFLPVNGLPLLVHRLRHAPHTTLDETGVHTPEWSLEWGEIRAVRLGRDAKGREQLQLVPRPAAAARLLSEGRTALWPPALPSADDVPESLLVTLDDRTAHVAVVPAVHPTHPPAGAVLDFARERTAHAAGDPRKHQDVRPHLPIEVRPARRGVRIGLVLGAVLTACGVLIIGGAMFGLNELSTRVGRRAVSGPIWLVLGLVVLLPSLRAWRRQRAVSLRGDVVRVGGRSVRWSDVIGVLWSTPGSGDLRQVAFEVRDEQPLLVSSPMRASLGLLAVVAAARVQDESPGSPASRKDAR